MTNTVNIPLSRIVGAVVGLAYGDMLGSRIEFQSFDTLKAAYPDGPRMLDSSWITDDTQMSLAVWYALDSWSGESLPLLRMDFITEFLAYANDPVTPTRAPGVTVMRSLRTLERMGIANWTQATSARGSGCGSVMRAAWVGLHPKVTDDNLFTIAAMQAVLSHGPAENAFCAAALAALTRALATDVTLDPSEAPGWLQRWADKHEGMAYDGLAFSNLWQLTKQSDDRSLGHDSPESYVAEGIKHVRWVADRAEELADRIYDAEELYSFDPAEVTGEGWRAKEAVAMAVGALASGALASDVVRIAAMTGGDSDSTAAIAGALAGAAYGESFPESWHVSLESRFARELATIVSGVWTV